MPTLVDIHEAEKQFSELLQRAMNGEQFIIAVAGNPIAVLAPYGDRPEHRIPGNDAGRIVIAPDFDDPLSEFD